MKEKQIKPMIFQDRLSIYNNCRRYYLDDHAYASILANIIRAKQCIIKNNISEYYDRENWVMLLLHYIEGLKLLLDAFPQAITIISTTDYNNLLIVLDSVEIKCYGMYMEHKTCLTNDIDILKYVITAATSIQIIMEHELEYKPEIITRLVARNIEASERDHEYKDSRLKKYYRTNGDNKQKTNKTYYSKKKHTFRQ